MIFLKMGANESEAISPAIQLTGYASLSIGNSSGMFDDVSIHAKKEPSEISLVSTPFHAVWSKNSTNQKNFPPRYEQCWSYSPTTNLLYVAFGQSTNQILLTDMVVFDPKTLKFKTLIHNLGEGRLNSSATMIDNFVYIFGGSRGSQYTNEFLRVDVTTKHVQVIPIDSPNAPSARSSPCIANYNYKIFIWGGNTGHSPDDSLYIYDIQSNEWEKRSSYIKSFLQPGYAQQDQYCYILGSNEETNLVRLDMETGNMIILHPSGTIPHTPVNRPALVSCGEFILCFGGSNDFMYTHMFGYSIEKNRWFVFHIKPTDESKKYGEVTNLGLFKIPRQDCQSVFYDETKRIVYYMFGNRLEQNVPIYEMEIGKAIAILNDEDDLLDALDKTE